MTIIVTEKNMLDQYKSHLAHKKKTRLPSRIHLPFVRIILEIAQVELNEYFNFKMPRTNSIIAYQMVLHMRLTFIVHPTHVLRKIIVERA